jgi:hypothetical protein
MKSVAAAAVLLLASSAFGQNAKIHRKSNENEIVGDVFIVSVIVGHAFSAQIDREIGIQEMLLRMPRVNWGYSYIPGHYVKGKYIPPDYSNAWVGH